MVTGKGWVSRFAAVFCCRSLAAACQIVNISGEYRCEEKKKLKVKLKLTHSHMKCHLSACRFRQEQVTKCKLDYIQATTLRSMPLSN